MDKMDDRLTADLQSQAGSFAAAAHSSTDITSMQLHRHNCNDITALSNLQTLVMQS